MENTAGKKFNKTEGPALMEQMDLVVRWRMAEKGKVGFITLFGVQMLRDKKQVTNLAAKILEAQQVIAQRQIRQSGALTESVRRSASTTRRAALSEKKIMPIRVTFDYK